MRKHKLWPVISVLFCIILLITFSCSRKGTPGEDNTGLQPTKPAPQLSPGNIPVSPVPTPQPPKKQNHESNIIASYSTPLIDEEDARIENIKLAAKKIDGYVLKPGKVFSFNGVVGSRTPQKGYKESKIIIDGEIKEGVGGGVCQLSTTLYNAAAKAKLEIVERHHHSKKVSYVPEGQDAAVSYGSLDLKFKNSMSYPIEIKAGINGKNVYVLLRKK